MAQMNHNAAYITSIDGITVWERLRVVRNFLLDRKQALALSELKLKQIKGSLETLDYYDREEKLIYMPQTEAIIEDAKREIIFLVEFEAVLAEEAEKTRIEGKTDEEMYEINYFEELIQKHLLEVQSEMLSGGRITPTTMKTLIKHPEAMKRVVEIGYLDKAIIQQIPSCLYLGV